MATQARLKTLKIDRQYVNKLRTVYAKLFLEKQTDNTTIASEQDLQRSQKRKLWWDKFRELHIQIYVNKKINAAKKLQKSYSAMMQSGENLSDIPVDNISQSSSSLSSNNSSDSEANENEIIDYRAEFLNSVFECEDIALEEFYVLLEPFFDPTKKTDSNTIVPDGELANYFLDFINLDKKYKNIYVMYNYNVKGFWSVTEFTDLLEQDRLDLKNLPKYLRIRLKYAVMWLSVGDGLVIGQIKTQIGDRVKDPISELLRAYVQYLESIHQIFYSAMQSIVTENNTKLREQFVKELSENSSIKEKVQWSKKYLSPVTPWVECFICMAIQEGIGFQPQFNVILAFSDMKVMKGLVYGTELVLRDENTHQLNWGIYYYLMDLRPPQEIFNEMIYEYISIEDKYIDYIESKCEEELATEMLQDLATQGTQTGELNIKSKQMSYETQIPPSLALLTPTNQKKSVRYQANMLAKSLGYKPPYVDIATQPIPYLEKIGMKKTQKFFEVRANDYVDAKQHNFEMWIEKFLNQTSLKDGEHETMLLSLIHKPTNTENITNKVIQEDSKNAEKKVKFDYYEQNQTTMLKKIRPIENGDNCIGCNS